MTSLNMGLAAGLYLLLINAAAYLAFSADERRAELRLRRLPESTLLLLCAAGGSPAGFAAQRVKRHKTRKRAFQVGFWTVVVAQVLALAAAVILI